LLQDCLHLIIITSRLESPVYFRDCLSSKGFSWLFEFQSEFDRVTFAWHIIKIYLGTCSPLHYVSLCLFFFARCSCKCHMLKLFSIISVKAKSFADREIRYTLKAQGQGAAGTFNIGPTSGIVKLAKELDFEDLRQPHIYSLIVTATEDSGGFSTSVEVNGFMFFSNYEMLFCCYRNRNNISFFSRPEYGTFACLLLFLLSLNVLFVSRTKCQAMRFTHINHVYCLIIEILAYDPSVRRKW